MKMEIEWKTGLPSHSGRYIVLTDYELTTFPYSNKHKAWNAFDHFGEAYVKRCSLTDAVICWADPIDIEELKRRFKESEDEK